VSGPWNLENDTTNGQTGSTTAADRRLTNRGELNGEVASVLITCYEDVTDLSGVSLACYDKVGDKLRAR